MSNRPGGKNRRRIQRALSKRDGQWCFYCGKVVFWAANMSEDNIQPDLDDRPIATIDHLKPLGKGGSNTLDNMIIACRPCHRKRHEQ